MPPRGTTGRSSSSTGARGPTGPQGQARSSPAGNKGGRPGAVARSPGAMRESRPVAGGAPRSAQKMVGTPRGYVKKADMARVDREMTPILNRATNILSVLPAARAAAAVSAAPKVRGAVSAAQNVIGRLTGSTAAAARKAKQIADIEKRTPRLQRMARLEAAARGKVYRSDKIPYNSPPKYAQIRPANKPVFGQKTASTINRELNRLTQSFGFGTGTVARAKTAATLAGGQEIGRTATEQALRSKTPKTTTRASAKNETVIMKSNAPRRSVKYKGK